MFGQCEMQAHWAQLAYLSSSWMPSKSQLYSPGHIAPYILWVLVVRPFLGWPLHPLKMQEKSRKCIDSNSILMHSISFYNLYGPLGLWAVPQGKKASGSWMVSCHIILYCQRELPNQNKLALLQFIDNPCLQPDLLFVRGVGVPRSDNSLDLWWMRCCDTVIPMEWWLQWQGNHRSLPSFQLSGPKLEVLTAELTKRRAEMQSRWQPARAQDIHQDSRATPATLLWKVAGQQLFWMLVSHCKP